MRRTTTLALVLALAAPLTACAHQPPIEIHTAPADHTTALTATGSATIAIAPDCADLTLTLTADAARPADAIATVRKNQGPLLDGLKRGGIADKDLALSQLSVAPVYRYEDQRTILDGFRAQITITATTEKFDLLGSLMETAAQAGVTEMSSRFRRTDLEALRKQVRDQALTAAQAKAKETAQVLGITLGPITSVSDAADGYLASNEYFPTARTGGAALGGEVQPLTINVTLTYGI
jgi:hypothetical protein